MKNRGEGRAERTKEAIILGAMLHDIGKFYQRSIQETGQDHQRLGLDFFDRCISENLTNLFSEEEKEIVRNAINSHHQVLDFITDADYIASGERERIKLEDEEFGNPREQSLNSIFAQINLLNQSKMRDFSYKLKPLSCNSRDIFPEETQRRNLVQEYKELWQGFEQEIKNIRPLSVRYYLSSVYYILQKYAWCVPSATYKSEPDVSLFDHLKIASAIAGALYLARDVKDKNSFLLVGADISGIQNFIYRIARAQGIGGISKRLRGRSFYLILLPEVIARYIVEKVGLFLSNILFCGGGVFKLLLPNLGETKSMLEDLNDKLNRWLFEEYGGELGIVIEWVEAGKSDLSNNYSALLAQLEEKIATAKRKKFGFLFKSNYELIEKYEAGIKVCRVCGISKLKDDQKPCDLCELHERIGAILPRAKYIMFCLSEISGNFDGEKVSFGDFGTVYILRGIEGNTVDNWLSSEKVLDLLRINETQIGSDIPGFRFVGNSAPLAEKSFSIEDSGDEDTSVRERNVLSFEIIADSSIGDKKLGILKMDVDFLGLIFSVGFEQQGAKSRKSISRLSSLSRMLDLFFCGYINKICDDAFEEWKNDKNNTWEHKDKVSQIFYIVYSGGDDLLIVGPWSEMPKLAKRIRDEFKAYTCYNPDINVSGGIFVCRPKYPVSLAAKSAGEFLEYSKDRGRNRITLFGDTVEWGAQNSADFEKLMKFGEYLFDCISDNKIPRRFVHRLMSIYKQYRNGDNLNYIPAVIYQIARNIDDYNIREDLMQKLIIDRNLFFKNIKIPASYALLKTRKEV